MTFGIVSDFIVGYFWIIIVPHSMPSFRKDDSSMIMIGLVRTTCWFRQGPVQTLKRRQWYMTWKSNRFYTARSRKLHEEAMHQRISSVSFYRDNDFKNESTLSTKQGVTPKAKGCRPQTSRDLTKWHWKPLALWPTCPKTVDFIQSHIFKLCDCCRDVVLHLSTPATSRKMIPYFAWVDFWIYPKKTSPKWSKTLWGSQMIMSVGRT